MRNMYANLKPSVFGGNLNFSCHEWHSKLEKVQRTFSLSLSFEIHKDNSYDQLTAEVKLGQETSFVDREGNRNNTYFNIRRCR